MSRRVENKTVKTLLKYALIFLILYEWALKWLSVYAEKHYNFVVYVHVVKINQYDKEL